MSKFSQEKMQQLHYDGMCGGACSECYEEQAYDDAQRALEEAEYQAELDRMYDADMDAYERASYEEMRADDEYDVEK